MTTWPTVSVDSWMLQSQYHRMEWDQSTGCSRDHKSRLTTCNAKGGSVAKHTLSSLRTFIIKVQGEVRMMPLFGADKVSTDPPPRPC